MKRIQDLRGKILAVLLAFFMIPVGCNKEKQKYIIPKDDFTDMLVDIHLMDGAVRQRSHGSPLLEVDSVNYYSAILRSYKYSWQQFDSSMVYYSRHIQTFENIYQEVLNRLNRKEAVVEEKLEKQRELEEKQSDSTQVEK